MLRRGVLLRRLLPRSPRVLPVRFYNLVDFKSLRENLVEQQANVDSRGGGVNISEVVELYESKNSVAKELDEKLRRRKELAKLTRTDETIQEARSLKGTIAECQSQLNEMSRNLDARPVCFALSSHERTVAAKIPNSTSTQTPSSQEGFRVLEYCGTEPSFDFAPLHHLDICNAHNLVDFESASTVSGAAALLELALTHWAMHFYASRGFEPICTPDLVRPDVVQGCGFNPRGEHAQIYHVKDHDLCLTGTAEVPLAGLVSRRKLTIQDLPRRYVGVGHSFRTEAGATGQADKGLYRLHQFTKVELFVVCHPDDSEREFESLLKLQKEAFGQLGLHFRVCEMPADDLGAPAHRKVDMEAFLAGRGGFGEISSTSNCTDYQSRRLNIRVPQPGQAAMLPHTLNGTACAVPRMILAILETHQQRDGSVDLPPVLRPLMHGAASIS